MESYRRGDIVLLVFPFTRLQRQSKRPALVLLDTGDADIVAARITSQSARTRFDLEITGWQEAGLLLPSIARLDKLATLEKRSVERRLGALLPEDLRNLKESLILLWQLE